MQSEIEVQQKLINDLKNSFENQLKMLQQEITFHKESQNNHRIEYEEMTSNMDNFEEALRCIKYEIKKLKYTTTPPNESVDFPSVKNDVSCLKYEIKRLKNQINSKTPISDNT